MLHDTYFKPELIQGPSMFDLIDKIPLNFCISKGSYQQIYSPNDGSPLTRVQYADSEDIQILLDQVPNSQTLMEKMPSHERSKILLKVAEIIIKNKDRLAFIIASEGGKPLKDSQVEVERAAQTLKLCAEEATRLYGECIPMDGSKAGDGHFSFTSRRPIGAVLAISAFNHPLNLLAHQVGSAIASGCTVVVKPAPATPLCAHELENYFREANLPEGIIKIIHADIPEIEKLISSPKFNFITFIGSSQVGWKLRKICAPGTRLNLEHGGQAPAIVGKTADIENSISALLKGAFYHAGQVCISTQKIYIHESIYDIFCQKFSKRAQQLITGDARDIKTDIGPMIRKSEVDRIQSWISEAISQGATLLLGNIPQGQYFTPTIILNVSEEVRLMKEELFAPVVALNSFNDILSLTEKLKQNPYAFESCIFSQDISECMFFANEMNSMTVVINNHNAFRVDWMPFGGHGLSGLGMGGVKYLINEMTCLKQIIIKK